MVAAHDKAIDSYFLRQVADAKSRYRGAIADGDGLYVPGTAAGLCDGFATAYLCPQSRFHKSAAALERLQLAAGFVTRSLSADGNLYSPITNFNSPPDTAFAVKGLAPICLLARRSGATEILEVLEPILRRWAASLTVGGIHTPNHRWVVCAALAQLNELFPNPAYLRRIDQWLAEGIDLDSDGQWTERSSVTYNGVSNTALVIMADKLKRPELLDPVRRNLDSMVYLLHADGEAVTDFSRRQDLHERGKLYSYWYALLYLAAKLGEAKYGMMARQVRDAALPLSAALLEPAFLRPDIPADPLPDNYVREFPHNHVVRIRKGLQSITVLTRDSDRFLSFRHGDAVVEAVRFASAFFGKGQFVPRAESRPNGTILLEQKLEGPYYQPFTPTRKISADEWDQTQKLRPQSEVCRLTQSARIHSTSEGLMLEFAAEGTDNVPVAIEINFREGGKLTGAEGKLITSREAVFTAGKNAIRIIGGGIEHRYINVRGARPHLAGDSYFITGTTPFRRVIEFRCS